MSNRSHIVGDGHGGQATATIECSLSNRSHVVGDGHGSQAAATQESIEADCGYATGNDKILYFIPTAVYQHNRFVINECRPYEIAYSVC